MTAALQTVENEQRILPERPGTPTASEKESSKIMRVVKQALKFVAGVAFFLANPGLFTAGFTAAILFPKQIRKAANRTHHFWSRLNTIERIGIGVGCFAAFPQAAACASLSWGAYLVTRMGEHEKAQNR